MWTYAGRTDTRLRVRRRLLAIDVIPLRAYELRKISHGHVDLGQIQAFLQEIVDHTIAGVHHPRDRAVATRYFAHPIFEIATALLIEVIVADARRVHALRDRCEPEGSWPSLSYAIVREGKFEIGRRSGTDLRFNRVALQITEDVTVDRYVVPLMQYDRALFQVLELVVVEGDGRCRCIDGTSVHLGQSGERHNKIKKIKNMLNR